MRTPGNPAGVPYTAAVAVVAAGRTGRLAALVTRTAAALHDSTHRKADDQ